MHAPKPIILNPHHNHIRRSVLEFRKDHTISIRYNQQLNALLPTRAPKRRVCRYHSVHAKPPPPQWLSVLFAPATNQQKGSVAIFNNAITKL